MIKIYSYNKTNYMQKISQICFWNKTLHVSDSSSVLHQELFTVHTAMVICHTVLLDSLLSVNLYDIYHCS